MSIFPVVKWGDRTPVISSGYRTSDRPGHNGVDIMFRRQPGDVDYPPGTPEGSKLFVMPPGIDVVAWRDGKLWSAGRADTGYFAVVDHGKPYATLYLHMETLAVPPTKASDTNKPTIRAGQTLGTVGFSPVDAQKLRHLHFEIWQNGGAEAHIDPAPLLKDSRAITDSRWQRLALAVGGLLALFGLSKRGGRNMPTS